MKRAILKANEVSMAMMILSDIKLFADLHILINIYTANNTETEQVKILEEF